MMGPVADDLGARLHRRIEHAGPISFAEFMEAALYDPVGGFFEGTAVGAEADFVTSPHVSPLFGTLLSRLTEDVRMLLGDPDPLAVVEVGAGDGTLGRHLASGLAEGGGRLTLVERTERQRASLAELAGSFPVPARVVSSLAELGPGSVTGCVLANELLDNLPFHRVRNGAQGPAELCVGLVDDELALVEAPPTTPETAAAANALAPGTEAIVPAGTYQFLAEVADVLERGYVVLIDYATAAGEAEVHGYRMHRPVADVLARPGTTDVTAGVDFDDVARFAETRGLRSWGCVTQRDLLLALGYREEMDLLLARQGELLNEGRGTEAARVFSERSRAGLLVDAGGLGGFRALCLGKGVSSPPRPWG
jgi:SAM-dependent MidA family methyltransferase